MFKTSLRSRFEEFIGTLPGIQNIDNLLSGVPDQNDTRADYLAENSALIIELKTLETDTEWKVERILETHRHREDFPVFFGTWEISKVLKHLPDGNEIQQRIARSVTTSIRAIFRKANGQINRSKDEFQLEASQGLLIILNQNVEVLTPEAIYLTFHKIAHSKNEQGNYRYSNIRAVLLLSEVHGTVLPGRILGFPVILMPFGNGEPFAHENFVRGLKEGWAEFNKARLVRDDGETKSVRELGFERLSFLNEAYKKRGPRYEVWARYYNQHNPYFRRYDDEHLKWFFKIIIYEIGRGFIKGGTKAESERGQLFWMEVFTHFMDEVAHRGIDIRFFTSDEAVWRELDELMERRFPDFERPERDWVDQWKSRKKDVSDEKN